MFNYIVSKASIYTCCRNDVVRGQISMWCRSLSCKSGLLGTPSSDAIVSAKRLRRLWCPNKCENTFIQNRKLFIAIVVGHVLRLYLAEGIVSTFKVLLCYVVVLWMLIPWGRTSCTMHLNPMGVVHLAALPPVCGGKLHPFPCCNNLTIIWVRLWSPKSAFKRFFTPLQQLDHYFEAQSHMCATNARLI